jgi:hypothetical protein
MDPRRQAESQSALNNVKPPTIKKASAYLFDGFRKLDTA